MYIKLIKTKKLSNYINDSKTNIKMKHFKHIIYVYTYMYY